jgi:2-oxoisovalerate dehydrogenase E1 component
MGVYWALAAANQLPGQVEVIDLRTLQPLDEAMIYDAVKRHGRVLLLTEEQQSHSFMESLAGRIQAECFRQLDAPVQVMGAMDLPAVPINVALEAAMLPNPQKVGERMAQLLRY